MHYNISMTWEISLDTLKPHYLQVENKEIPIGIYQDMKT
jgi:hypothetical protein